VIRGAYGTEFYLIRPKRGLEKILFSDEKFRPIWPHAQILLLGLGVNMVCRFTSASLAPRVKGFQNCLVEVSTLTITLVMWGNTTSGACDG
jgi:hypothetical protein